MVFHNQGDNISSNLQFLDKRLSEIDCDVPFIHTSPLIRQDEPFEDLLMTDTSFSVTKTFYQEDKQIEEAFRRQIKNFIEYNLEYFQIFEKITVYYDCGQSIISKILRDTFGKIFDNRMDFRTAYQKDYRLMQVADFICTLEQSKIRWDEHRPTKSEKDFFLTRQMFMKNFYKKIRRKHI